MDPVVLFPRHRLVVPLEQIQNMLFNMTANAKVEADSNSRVSFISDAS
jgi:hypothetical protein